MKKALLTLGILFAILYFVPNRDVVVIEPEIVLGAASDIVNDATLSTNLVSCWSFDESSGTREDSATNGNDLTDNNTVGSASGLYNNAADFERDNSEYLSITDASQTGLDISEDFSVYFYIDPEVLSGDSFILGKGQFSNSTQQYLVWLEDSGRLNFRFSDDGTNNNDHARTWSTSTSAVSVTDPSTVVFTLDLSTETGSLWVASSTVSVTPSGTSMGASLHNSAEPFYVGARRNSGSPTAYWDGLVDELAIWSKVLSAGEISDLFNSGSGLQCDAGGGGGGGADTGAPVLLPKF